MALVVAALSGDPGSDPGFRPSRQAPFPADSAVFSPRGPSRAAPGPGPGPLSSPDPGLVPGSLGGPPIVGGRA